MFKRTGVFHPGNLCRKCGDRLVEMGQRYDCDVWYDLDKNDVCLGSFLDRELEAKSFLDRELDRRRSSPVIFGAVQRFPECNRSIALGAGL